jgi:hypothetical protein
MSRPIHCTYIQDFSYERHESIYIAGEHIPTAPNSCETTVMTNVKI